MKHAYLIIAHNEYPVLRALLSMLDDERNDIYLHIDQRAAELYEKIYPLQMQRAGLHILSARNKVYWGDLSQVETEYLLLETASAKESYSYYHLLSGTDLPIQTQDYIHSFFQINAGKEFVNIGSAIDTRKT
ncbi:MAG: beta-1,6-N-acetylglucosaminyltransferase [Bacteroides intestinalis]